MARRIMVLGATSLIGWRLLDGPRPPDVELIAVSRGGGQRARPSRRPLRKLLGMTDGRDGEAGRHAEQGSQGAPVSKHAASDVPIHWIAADLADRNLAGHLPLVDVILSLSPIWLLPPALPALLSTGAGRLIAFSSTSRLTKADSPVPAEREVARRLAEGEAALQAACEAAGVAWTILRPTMIYAEGEDANVSRLAALIARLGVLPLSGRGEGLRQPVHAADLAAAAWRALDAPASFGRTYALPGGETLTYRQMTVRVFEALGRRPRLISLPPPLWRLGLALASPWLPGATAAMGLRMGEDLAFDAGPAKRDFGYAPRPFRPMFPR